MPVALYYEDPEPVLSVEGYWGDIRPDVIGPLWPFEAPSPLLVSTE